MPNFFESPFKGVALSEQVTHPNIDVGRYSYYSGYYHGHRFDDCARYLLPGPDADRLVIGSFCSIGTGASFVMAGNQGHRHDWISTFPFFFLPDEPAFAGARNGYRPAGDTVIGHDVWIGAEAMIMPGIRVGHVELIGARAVVTRDVPPYAIVAGNPARVVRHRFDEARIASLLETTWWNRPRTEIERLIPLLLSERIDDLLEALRKRPSTGA